MESRKSTRIHYENIIAKTKESMQQEFEREGIPATVLDQIVAAWRGRIESSQAMEPLGKVVSTQEVFKSMVGLATPMQLYKEDYFSREVHPTAKVEVKPVEPPPPEPVKETKPDPAPAEEEDDDPYAAMFNQMKAKNEEQKAPPPKKEPSEDELAHVSDEETSIANPLETDTMCGLCSKVTRSKNRWKCTLTKCVLNFSGKDFIYQQVAGAMEFQ